MKTLYADSVPLKLDTGNEVEAFVRTASAAGKRPKCLLLHGNPGSLLDFQQLVPRLAAVADLAAIDLPGFGKSSRVGPGAEFLSLDRLAEYTISALNALDWREPIFLVGHSHGGGVAQVAAARFPERIAGLGLVATLGAPAHASYRLLALPGAARFVQIVGRMFRYRPLGALNRAILRGVMTDMCSPELVAPETLERELAVFAARPEILLSMVQVALGQPCARLWQSAPEIRCPTLFVHGCEDSVVPVRCALAIHDRLVNAGGRSKFRLVPAAGHMLIKYQALALVDRLVQHLLTEEFQSDLPARAP